MKINLHVFEQIKKYFHKGYSYTIFLKLLKKDYDISISMRILKRTLSKGKLRRKNCNESPIEEVVAAILLELQGSGCNLGYRSMWKRLSKIYKLTVKQKTVMRLLKEIDPDGVEARCRYRLKRRTYKVPGPNHLWHVDNHDKIKRYGFPVYGCIDGFSKEVVWINVSKTNNDPAIIGSYFLNAVERLGYLPTLIRADKGTKANLMENFQIALRYNHDDEFAGESSFIRGKSTRNQRIESYWRQFREHMGDFYIHLFKKMENENLIQIDNPVHIESLRYCFGKIIEEEIEITRKEWNEHRIRKQNNRGILSGKPNELHKCPELFNANDCRKQVDLDAVEYLKRYVKEPVLVSTDFKEFADSLMCNHLQPSTAEEAFCMYVDIINFIENEMSQT